MHRKKKTKTRPQPKIIWPADDGFVWKENSKAMYDVVCKEDVLPLVLPGVDPGYTRRALSLALTEKVGSHGEVTEQLMYQVCREVLPSPYLQHTLQTLDAMKTATTARPTG